MISKTENNGENILAVAILAAAQIRAHPAVSMHDAVAAARDALGGGRCPRADAKKIAASVRADKIQCLEDGTWHTMLRRYIMRRYNMTPHQYREKWGLPVDYPFVAPDYAARRRKIAVETGLGKK